VYKFKYYLKRAVYFLAPQAISTRLLPPKPPLNVNDIVSVTKPGKYYNKTGTITYSGMDENKYHWYKVTLDGTSDRETFWDDELQVMFTL
jgi:hypothetical protein